MANRTKFTVKKREMFLATLIKTGNVSRAAAKVGISRRRMYELKKEDLEFSQEWDDAIDIGVDALEEEARRRAFTGTLEPVFYKGVKVGTIRRYSDTLLIVLLKAHRDKFKEKTAIEHTGAGGGPIQNQNINMTAEEFKAIAEQIVKDV